MKKLMHIAMVALLAGAAVLYTGCTKDYTGEVKDLQSVTSSLQSQVDALKATDTNLQNAINQANTLINDLKTQEAKDIAGINTLIEGINKSIADLQSKDEEILEAIDVLEDAIKTGDEKTLADAKKYADEQISKMADDLKVLINGEAEARKNADDELRGFINDLIANLDQEILDRKAADVALAAADAGLQEQIKSVEGLVSELKTKEEKDVADLYTKISTEVAAINGTIEKVNDRIDELETLVGKLVNSFKGRIQSIIAVVPGVGDPAEAVSYSFAGTDTTVVEMKFNVSPAAAASKVSVDNAKVVVTESEISTRATVKPDYCTEYVPTSVTVSGNVVTVKALVAPKTSAENSYWVSLKVADTDEVGAPVEVISSPAKASEEVVEFSAEDLLWYTKVNGQETLVKKTDGTDAPISAAVQIVNEGSAPTLLLPLDKQNYSEGFVAKAPFADYYVKVTYTVNGKSVAKTLPELSEMFGTEIALTSDATVAKTFGWEADEDVIVPEKSKYLEKNDFVTFAVDGTYPAKTAAFSYKVEGDVNTREAVGILGVYAEGAKFDETNGFTFPGMKINGKAFANLAAIYVARVAKDSDVVFGVDGKLNNVWDYKNFDKTYNTEVENGNGLFTNLAWKATTATEFRAGAADEIRPVVNGVEGAVVTDGTFSIARKAAGYVDAKVTGVKVSTKDVDYVAVYKKNSKNAHDVEYYSYDTKVNFAVEGKHENVTKSFDVPSFVPAQSYSTSVEVKDFFKTVFADEAAWFGSLGTDPDTKANATSKQLYSSYLGGAEKHIVANSVKVDGKSVSGVNANFTLNLVSNEKVDSASVTYATGALAYGSKYEIVFIDNNIFGVNFKYTVVFTTADAPAFYLDYTAVVDPENNSVVVKGEESVSLLIHRYILEDLHISKYLKVAGTIDPKEVLTIECVGKDYRAKNIGEVAEYGSGKTFNNTTGKLPENDSYYFSWNKNFESSVYNGNLKDTEFTAYFILKAGNAVVPSENGVTVKYQGVDVVALPINFYTAVPITVTTETIQHKRQSGVRNPINVLQTLSVKGIIKDQELWNKTIGYWYPVTEVVSYDQSLAEQIAGVKSYKINWDKMTATFDGRPYSMTPNVDYTVDDQTITLLNENAVGTIEIVVPIEINHYFDQAGANPVKATVKVVSVLE